MAILGETLGMVVFLGNIPLLAGMKTRLTNKEFHAKPYEKTIKMGVRQFVIQECPYRTGHVR